jgi:hypothetical protein
MPNFNDATITRLFVSQLGSTVEDDTPNAPNKGDFCVNIEMVAGTALQSEEYTLTFGCTDITMWAYAPGLIPAPLTPPVNGKFDVAPWVASPSGLFWVYEQQATVTRPVASGQGHLYQYSATLVTGNGQVASSYISDPFLVL